MPLATARQKRGYAVALAEEVLREIEEIFPRYGNPAL